LQYPNQLKDEHIDVSSLTSHGSLWILQI